MVDRTWTLALYTSHGPPLVCVVPESPSSRPDDINLLVNGRPMLLVSQRLRENLDVVRSDLEYHVCVALERFQEQLQKEGIEVLPVAPEPPQASKLGAAGGQLPPAQEGGEHVPPS
ncbi:MAG: hypothetical protein L0Z62_47040 [Gemmataceae bacterium]|nr:hypothetical protein [Gemmataceae bacterium]